jgi:hypothetical protein
MDVSGESDPGRKDPPMTTQYVTPQEAGVKIGDFFYASWGYDQTNVDFWKVVGLTPKGMKVQKWQSKVDHSNIHDYVVPGDRPAYRETWWDPETDERLDKPIVQIPPVLTKRIQMWGEGDRRTVAANWKSYASMYLWDDTPKYQTGFGYGH